MDGRIRYEIVVGIQAEARRRAALERLPRMAMASSRAARSLRSAVRVVFGLPIPA
jgi:hypothetical protein